MPADWDHVILLSADALRADHLSCYGYHRDTSPILDELATESIRFTNAYSASSHTREAVPALLTGEYPDTAVGDDFRLATETVASTLSSAGYATAGFHSNPFISRAYGFDRGFDTFDDDMHFGSNKLLALAQRALDKLRNRHYARATEINERSLDWLDSRGDEPLFLWNHYLDTHGPYEPPSEYATEYRASTVSDREAQSLYRRAIRDPESISEDERALLIDLYDAEIRYNDAKLGEMLTALRDRGLLERSLLVFTSDHGDAFGEHGYYEHPRYLHEEITRVPLLVRPPGGVDGETVSTPVSTLDIAATIRAGLDREVGEGRVSLLGELPAERTVFVQARGEDEHSHLRRYAARRSDGACFCERDRETETVEFGECSGRELREELDAHVEARVREGGETNDAAGEDDAVDEEIERRLSALGYKE
ncbi:sulfatase [Haloplanus ruber]|uniref:Sulfatase n=1 Tax=Haloplanus ruber TaxID=869892 RepID=A0ABD6CYI7_9EURY|nr:sulfatase [Haloplanus ruber]